MKKNVFFTAGCIVLAVFMFSTLSMAETFRWKMASSWPKGTILQDCADDFAAKVSAMSNGRLQIKSYAAGELMGALEVTEGVRMGTIDVSHCSPSYQVGKLPAGPLFGYIPFGMKAVPYLTWYYQDEGMQLYRELYEPFDPGYAAPCGILPMEDLAWSNKPINTIEDFKGLKFRTSGYWGEILNNAGASVVMLPAGEIYEALQRQVIDAGEFSIPSMDKDLAFYEITKYLLLPGVHQPSTILDININKRSWNKLPDDLKEVVKTAAQAMTLETLTLCINRDVHALEFFQEKGVNFEYLAPEVQKELKAKTNDLMQAKAEKDPFFAKVWESQKQFRERYNRYETLTEIQD
ncbi:MAG: TRAP transporter substrate-binding protein DctP [Desulfohalobiaceae bacterium]|nr:TRAP transporter substrate-binding protein DctP [Desulfohalobiaceae bacterium]